MNHTPIGVHFNLFRCASHCPLINDNYSSREKTLAVAAAKAGMDEKTARRYRDLGKLPSESRCRRDWRTRPDPFEEVWEQLRAQVGDAPGLEAKTLFDALQREHPGRFAEGQREPANRLH